MTGAILMKTVPAMTMRSASRGVPRITSAPKREMSYLLVMLVAISTKQQERPKLKGQTEFLRPHATRSSRRDKMRVRRIASSRNPSVFSACGGAPGRLSDQRINSPSVSNPPSVSASLSPVERANTPQIEKGCNQYRYEHQRLGVTGPSTSANDNCPGEDENRLNIEDDEEHCDEIELS